MRSPCLQPRRPVTLPAIDTLFDTAQCLNCTTPLTGPYCAQCGQKKAGRMGAATVRKEAWARFRWFEWDMVRNALRVLPQPGTVAREYVRGRRKDHPHPLTLLCLAIGCLLIVLGHTDYLRPAFPSEAAARMYALVAAYSKWSFSLGALAAFASAWLLFVAAWATTPPSCWPWRCTARPCSSHCRWPTSYPWCWCRPPA